MKRREREGRLIASILAQAEANGADPAWVDRWIESLKGRGVLMERLPAGGYLVRRTDR